MTFASRIVGTRLGHAAKRIRGAVEIATASHEMLGTLANDYLAEYLVTRLSQTHFVDVGAHIGSIIAQVRRHCPSRITAIEPISAKAKHLRNRFAGVTVIECALSDTEGEAAFFINPAASGYSSLNSGAGTVEISVPLKRLDGLVSDPDVIKIDVEGAELGVLRGSEGIGSRPLIMFESAPADVLGYTKPDLWQWFEDHDYAVFLPNRLAHAAPPMTLELFLDAHHYPRRATNYFGVPREKVIEVRDRARRILTRSRVA
jgi:FkbM family methyltransferase